MVRRSSGVERLVCHTAPLFRSSSLVLRDPDLGDCAWITVCLALGRRFWGPYWCTQRKVTSMLFLLGPVRALEPVFNGVEEVHVPAGHTSQDLVQGLLVDILSTLPRVSLVFRALSFSLSSAECAVGDWPCHPFVHNDQVSFGFPPLACLLGNASCSKARQRGLPFCLHFVKRLPSTQLLITIRCRQRRMKNG